MFMNDLLHLLVFIVGVIKITTLTGSLIRQKEKLFQHLGPKVSFLVSCCPNGSLCPSLFPHLLCENLPNDAADLSQV